MEKIFVIKGTNLTIHMPKELDHHNAEEIKREADRLEREISGASFLISRRPALWTAPASA